MNSRERLSRAEEEFDELTQGGRDLIISASEPSFQFFDGEIVKGYGPAADRAEQHVKNIKK